MGKKVGRKKERKLGNEFGLPGARPTIARMIDEIPSRCFDRKNIWDDLCEGSIGDRPSQRGNQFLFFLLSLPAPFSYVTAFPFDYSFHWITHGIQFLFHPTRPLYNSLRNIYECLYTSSTSAILFLGREGGDVSLTIGVTG